MNKGVWLVREYLQGGIIDRQRACSECDYTTGHVTMRWQYCPECGSRMFFNINELREFSRIEKAMEDYK